MNRQILLLVLSSFWKTLEFNQIMKRSNEMRSVRMRPKQITHTHVCMCVCIIVVCDQMSYLFIALYDKNQWFFFSSFFFFFLSLLLFCVSCCRGCVNIKCPGRGAYACVQYVSLCRRSNPLYINWFSFSLYFINIVLFVCVCVSLCLYLNGSMFIQFRSFAL